MIAALLLASASLQPQDEEFYSKRMQAHLLISDSKHAMQEGESALKKFPESKPLRAAYLAALSERGEELKALQAWSEWGAFSIEDPVDRKMLETLAWGVLRKAGGSSQTIVRLNALIGASMTHDAKALPILLSQMRSSNASIRAFAVRVAASFGDDPLRDEIARLLKEEKVWYVRLEVILAAGKMRLYELKHPLQEIVASPTSLAEEKAAAISALVGMYDTVENEELHALAFSNRAGLRSLCAQLIGHFEIQEKMSLLSILLKDTSSDVRMAAIEALCCLKADTTAVKQVEPLLQDPSVEVGISAAYFLLLHKHPQAEEALDKWVRSELPEVQRAASAAIAASGRYGTRLMLKVFTETENPYVKVNIARALIGQRIQVKLAAKAIHDILLQEKRVLWMWEPIGERFQTLAPSTVRHREGFPHYPAVIDQLTRLELLSNLSMAGYENRTEAAREFLKAKSWNVSAMAAALVLQEGSEEDVAVVADLLQDPDEKIRCLAALILAAVGKDSTAVATLQEVYPSLDRDLKVHVLQALGYVGDRSSIPFLLELLDEPFQILRVVTASALIQCLYH
ncbi:MAG: hypothetical protein RLZZ453_48 [Chlamydiota bacterium]|jgi:HEAT repeat protein